jgi:hypothetical protein
VTDLPRRQYFLRAANTLHVTLSGGGVPGSRRVHSLSLIYGGGFLYECFGVGQVGGGGDLIRRCRQIVRLDIFDERFRRGEAAGELAAGHAR